MPDDYVGRNEFSEYKDRVDAEEERQNKRIDILEKTVQQISELTTSVREMAVSLQNMTKEMGRQGERLERLESVPGDNWKSLKAGIIGAIAAAIGCGLVAAVISSI